MSTTKKSIQDMNKIIKEYKEYQELKKELEANMEELKAQAIEILGEEKLDEFVCQEGKITYRERVSNRFQSTEFKKIHKDLYDAFTMPTSAMFFTCN